MQQRRHKSLSATGEVVTAETLRQARAVRDAGWQTIRSAFIDRPAQAAPGHHPEALPADLPNAFERAQAQADRQADLLREGATRAAEMAECEQRIAEMTQSLAEHQQRPR